MIQPQEHDYYYGSEAERYTFYLFPKVLFSNDRYKAISDSAKILYGLMLDRMGLYNTELLDIFKLLTKPSKKSEKNRKNNRSQKSAP